MFPCLCIGEKNLEDSFFDLLYTFGIVLTFAELNTLVEDLKQVETKAIDYDNCYEGSPGTTGLLKILLRYLVK
jgi:hypothetical protein